MQPNPLADKPAPCVRWPGLHYPSGYGRAPGDKYPHRETWRTHHGEIPDDHEIHHTCEVRDCYTIKHLECLTRAEHVATHQDQRTHCRRGHKRNEANVYYWTNR